LWDGGPPGQNAGATSENDTMSCDMKKTVSQRSNDCSIIHFTGSHSDDEPQLENTTAQNYLFVPERQ